MIKIAGLGDTVFEEAYFVLKPRIDKSGMSEKDIIAEANRIIRNSSFFNEKSTRFIKIKTPLFFLLISTSVVGIISTVAMLVLVF